MTFVLFLAMALIQTLQPGTGFVTGTLRAADGQSVRGIRVAAVPADDPTFSSFASLAETDAAGNFRLVNLPAGAYYIMAGRVELPTYYPAGMDKTAAGLVTVDVARTTSGINFVMARESRRPPVVLSAEDIYNVLMRATSEENPGTKLRLLLDFERRFPRSEYLAEAQAELMGVYGMRGDTRKAAEYADKAVKSEPDNALLLIQVSRNFAAMYSGLPKAVQIADQAVAAVTRAKGRPRPDSSSPQAWTAWLESLDKSARENQAWIRGIVARRAAGTPRR